MSASLSPASHEGVFLNSYNPATGEILGKVPLCSVREVQSAIAKAKSVQMQWQSLGFTKRASYILKVRDLLLADIDDVARLISNENGKPFVEAIGHDITPCLDLMTYFAKNSQKILKSKSLCLGKWNFMGRKSYIEYYPFGVVGVIAPWNFPLSIPLGEVVMALMAGNTVVLKPSEHTSLVGVKIKEMFERVGLPQDVLQLVTGDGSTGAALVEGGCDKIVFTGSVATGKKIMQACAKNLTSLTLELGGKDPFICFADAPLDTATSAAVWGAFSNSGQICASVERVYVQDTIYDEFVKQVVAKTKLLKQGPASDPEIEVGAMTMAGQIKIVEKHVAAAKAGGAQILTGGEREANQKGQFYPPTVITGIDDSFECVRDETFGPLLPIMKFATEDEVIKRANDSEYGLNAYVWTKDRTRARRVAAQLQVGTVNINEAVFTHAVPQTPWGGPKASGMGRTHGSAGLLDLVEMRHVHENTKTEKKNYFWWYGYGPQKVEMMKTVAVTLFGKGSQRLGATVKLLKMMLKAKVN